MHQDGMTALDCFVDECERGLKMFAEVGDIRIVTGSAA